MASAARHPPMLRVAFGGEVTGHEPTRGLDHGILAAHWMTRVQLEAQAARLRSPLVLRCIDDFLAGHCEPLATVASLDLDTAASARAIVVS